MLLNYHINFTKQIGLWLITPLAKLSLTKLTS